MSQRGRKAKTKQTGGTGAPLGGAAEDLRSLAGSVLAQVSQVTRQVSQGLVQRSASVQPEEAAAAAGGLLQDVHVENDTGLDVHAPSTHTRTLSPTAYVDPQRGSPVTKPSEDKQGVPSAQQSKDPPQSTRKGLKSMSTAEPGHADRDAGLEDHDIADDLYSNKELDGVAHVSTFTRSPASAKITPLQQTSHQQQHQQHLGAEPRLHDEFLSHDVMGNLQKIPEGDSGLCMDTTGPARLRNSTQIVKRITRYITPTTCFFTLFVAVGIVAVLLGSRNNNLALSQQLVHSDLTTMRSIVTQLSSRLSTSEQADSSKDNVLQALHVQLLQLQDSLHTTSLNMTSTHSQLSSVSAALEAHKKASAMVSRTARDQLSQALQEVQELHTKIAAKALDESRVGETLIDDLHSCDLQSLSSTLGPLLLTRTIGHSPVVGDARVIMKFYQAVSKVGGRVWCWMQDMFFHATQVERGITAYNTCW